MPDIASEVVSAILDESEAHVRETGQVPRPQVHIVAEDMNEPYLGYIICRQFYRGTDAATAIADLGRLPSALAATRVFVVWEDYDLRTALEMPTERPLLNLAVVDARADGHTMLWLPFDAVQHGAEIVMGWREPARYENVPLPAPIEALLKVWRQPPEDLKRTVLDLQKAGYRIKWSIAYK